MKQPPGSGPAEPAQQPFEIRYHRRDDDAYFYSDTDESWAIASTTTGDEICAFCGHSYERRSGTTEGGVESVALSAACDEVIATHYDGTVERVELPIRVELSEGGRAITLSFRDGRRETRERRPVMFHSKYGQPIIHPLQGDPDRPSHRHR